MALRRNALLCMHTSATPIRPECPIYFFTPGKQVLDFISKKHPGNIWLMGGGEIIRYFMHGNLIDKYYIYVMPTILGNGIPLFPAGFPKTNLKLESCKNIEEIVELIYRRNTDNGWQKLQRQLPATKSRAGFFGKGQDNPCFQLWEQSKLITLCSGKGWRAGFIRIPYSAPVAWEQDPNVKSPFTPRF